MLTSSTKLQNRSFHVLERTRTSSKCQKMKSARAKREKILFFIVKYENLWGFLLPSSSWLLTAPYCIQQSSGLSCGVVTGACLLVGLRVSSSRHIFRVYSADLYGLLPLMDHCFDRQSCRLLAFLIFVDHCFGCLFFPLAPSPSHPSTEVPSV